MCGTYDRKSTDDDDDGWHDNYDGDGDNIDEIYDKITFE